MSLETFVIEGIPPLAKALDGERFWALIERHAPRAMSSVANRLKGLAPKGKSGKLSRGFDVRAKRIRQGLIQGIQVDIGARVPYGHLVERGHNVIPRGPGRKGLSAVALSEKGPRGKLLRGRRAELRKALLARRASGPIGRVPGRFFARSELTRSAGEVMSLLGRLVMQDLRR